MRHQSLFRFCRPHQRRPGNNGDLEAFKSIATSRRLGHCSSIPREVIQKINLRKFTSAKMNGLVLSAFFLIALPCGKYYSILNQTTLVAWFTYRKYFLGFDNWVWPQEHIKLDCSRPFLKTDQAELFILAFMPKWRRNLKGNGTINRQTNQY